MTLRHLMTGLALLGLSACAGLAEKQAAVVQFGQAAHAASTAEMSFLRAVETVNCEDQYYAAALAYAQGKSTNFDLNGSCRPTAMSPEQIATRQALLDAVTLYADKMQAIASAGDAQALGQNDIALAQKLGGMARAGGIGLPSPELAHGVAAAFDAVAKMALDQVKYRDLRAAASSMQRPLETVVGVLVSENEQLAQFMTASLGHMQLNLKIAIAQAHGKQNATAADTFFQIVEARRVLMRANPLAHAAFVAPENGTSSDVGGSAVPVNQALNALVDANRQMSQAGSGGMRAAAVDVYQRAMSARNVYNAIGQ